MGYLIQKDFNKSIQADNLAQVIGSDQSVLCDAETFAYSVAKSKLIQKYDISQELQDTPGWDATLVYKAANRVYLNPPAYNTATNYIPGSYTTYGGNVYICNTDTTGVFTLSAWTLVATQYQIYYAAYPAQVFNLYACYNVGDVVYWKGNVYTALRSSTPLDQTEMIQYGTYENLPFINIFPDNVQNGPSAWGVGVPYTVPAETDIQNTTYWTKGDNRNAELRTHLVSITLYQVHQRISPNNIPELRRENYHMAMQWLKEASGVDGKDGGMTVDLPVKQPTQGMRVRSGGNVKLINRY
jgi:hypothetical protein